MTAVNIRNKVLADVGAFAEAYTQAALGNGVLKCTDPKIRDEMWALARELIVQADDPVQLKGLSEGSIAEKVDTVLAQVADGQLTIQQGKRLIEMLQAGFDITELPSLIEKLHELEGR